jgi:hypothetical protein
LAQIATVFTQGIEELEPLAWSAAHLGVG